MAISNDTKADPAVEKEAELIWRGLLARRAAMSGLGLPEEKIAEMTAAWVRRIDAQKRQALARKAGRRRRRGG